MTGYNITCDPGSLYSRKCYVNTATGKQEIIGYDASGNPISKAPTTAAGTAWQPSVTVLDQDGNSTNPTGLRDFLHHVRYRGHLRNHPFLWSRSSGLEIHHGISPGSFSRRMYQERTCNPLWNTQGCKTSDDR